MTYTYIHIYTYIYIYIHTYTHIYIYTRGQYTHNIVKEQYTNDQLIHALKEQCITSLFVLLKENLK